MRESLWVTGLDTDATVVDVSLLLPGRVVHMPQAAWLLEFDAREHPPPIGSTLKAVRDSD
jgi:hypothetical protein